MAFVYVADGIDDVLAAHLNQYADAWSGVAGKGVPFNAVAVNDPINFAISARNLDPTNSRAAQFLKADGTVLFQCDASGVKVSPDGTVASVPATLTATQTFTNKTFTNPHMTTPVVDSGGLTVTAGGITVNGGNPSIGFGAQANPIITGGTGALYFQNNANTVANVHFPDAGGITIDRGNLILSAGSIVSPLISGATPIAAVGQLGLGVTADAKGAGGAATLGTVGGTGPATTSQNAWLRININGTNCWLAYWT